MAYVKLLDTATINKIAAGEVVERPASCVKELVENSIDAGASRIEIEIQNGGKALIRVTDNGAGMNREDAALAVKRHATSKLVKAADLQNISTLGFRGEAL
ncbi:MAG: ATP-binding protein, partial [Selenomonadaceae bacterium]|nr:ATP-binding protein [Selenomonadaceae bacterium]